MRRSYSALAEGLGVELCAGVARSGFYCREFDHSRTGGWEPGRVHWADVRVSRPGIARFLKLAALALDPAINDEPPWRRVYRLNVESRRLARLVHVREPGRDQTSFDKAFVRASVAGLPNTVPLRREANDWARR